MASSTKVTVVERCLVSPPPGSVAPASLPLTFFDIPWLLFPPTQPLFFYQLPTSTAHFIQTILPELKHSLSLTLHHFFPLAGKLVMLGDGAAYKSQVLAPPQIEYTEDDAVSLTVAAAEGGVFKNLIGNHGKMSGDFHGLIPAIKAAEGFKQPLLSIQITVFPESGISIGFTIRNVVADWRTFKNFLSAWASLTKNGGVLEEQHVAFHDRSVVGDPSGLGPGFLNEWRNIKNESYHDNGSTYDTVRATFVVGPKEMEQIKKWILTRSEKVFGSVQLLLNPYVLVCAFTWVCWINTHWPKTEAPAVHYFGFIAGGLTRFHYTVPSSYVGNCVGFGRSAATRRELTGENGVVFAAKAIGDTIKKLNGDMLSGAQNWISEWKEIRESGPGQHIMITGSPKLGLYDLDFGWGRPSKFEEMSIDTTNAVSLSDSKEIAGGIEIRIALSKSKMDVFTALFNKQLNLVNNS